MTKEGRTGVGFSLPRLAVTGLAVAYLAGILLRALGPGPPERLLPRVPLYFTQVACLFPTAAEVTVDYRAEGFRCGGGRWLELETRRYFPIGATDKENRFHRAMHFYRKNRPTMQALDAFLVARHKAAGEPAIGGVRPISLRIPLPKPGGLIERFDRRALEEHPEEIRKYWYETPKATRLGRCSKAAQ